MKKITTADVLELSVPERIELVEDIWDSLIAVPDSISLTKAQREELDRRLESYHQNPEAGSPWEVVRERIKGGG